MKGMPVISDHRLPEDRKKDRKQTQWELATTAPDDKVKNREQTVVNQVFCYETCYS